MSKLRTFFEVTSFGVYQNWDPDSKTLPQISSFTTNIPAQLDIEFGFILRAKKAKGKRLDWTIYHPQICDKHGQTMPPFEGSEYVKNNDWEFYLGDTIWEPIEDKVGDWRMVIECDNKIVVEKTFSLAVEHGDGEIQFWKKRGY